MFSRRRLIVKGLKVEDIKCDLPKEEEEVLCFDCGVALQLAAQIIGGRPYCKACAPWYKEREDEDKKALEEDLKRDGVISTKELHYNDWDYWD